MGTQRLLSTILAISILATGCSLGSGEAAQPVGSASTIAPAASTTLVENVRANSTSIATVKDGLSSIRIFDSPTDSAIATHEFDSPRKPPGVDATVPTVFTVVNNTNAPAGWLNINVPAKPNGTTGWVRRDSVDVSFTLFKIFIDRANFKLQLLEDGEVILETPVAIGTGDAATPVGKFFLTELLASDNAAYGPFAYGLSGFSEDFESFQGEDAIIGIHGTNEPESIGTNASHGCVRVPNEVISNLAEFLPLGTPVEII